MKVGDKVVVNSPDWPKWNGEGVVDRIFSDNDNSLNVLMTSGDQAGCVGGFPKECVTPVSAPLGGTITLSREAEGKALEVLYDFQRAVESGTVIPRLTHLGVLAHILLALDLSVEV